MAEWDVMILAGRHGRYRRGDERGTDFVRRVLSRKKRTVRGEYFREHVFERMVRNVKLNKYDVSSMYFNYAGSIYSQNFPIIDIVMNTMLKQEESSQGRHFFRMFSGMGDDHGQPLT
ncbi:MAG: hypothetical protein ACLTZT_14820 [Butyricimonas faecalis]